MHFLSAPTMLLCSHLAQVAPFSIYFATPGHHLSVFIVPSMMVKHPQRLLGWRYLVSTPAQTFDAYDVWEQLSVSPTPVVAAIYLGTVLQIYGRALIPILRTMWPWHHDPSSIVRRIMPMAK